MEKRERNILVALATALIGGAVCAAVAALRWCSVCRISYLDLGRAARASS